MHTEHQIIKLKLDLMFKRVFGNPQNELITAAFLSDILEIPRESIRRIVIENPDIIPNYYDKKFSILDLKLDVDGRTVNIELQVNRESDFKDRTLYYWSKLYSESLGTGEAYGELRETICINILNFNLFDCDDYHSHFKVMEKERHEILTDKFAIHFFELKKLSKCVKKKRMEDWLNLINAETEEELMAIQNTTTIPEVKNTIFVVRKLNADEKMRQEAFYREMQLHNEASALGGARREGIAEGEAKGFAKGLAEGEAKIKAKIEAQKKEIAERMRVNGYEEADIKRIIGE